MSTYIVNPVKVRADESAKGSIYKSIVAMGLRSRQINDQIKTQISERLADVIVDTDEAVENQSGRAIPELFTSLGEKGFRDLETFAIRSVSVQSPSVISLGGGAILRPENREILKATGFTVWLQASAEQLAARLSEDEAQGKRRPSLTALGTLGEIATVLKQREPLYRESSDLILQSATSSPIELAKQIAVWFQIQRGQETLPT